LNTKIFLEVHHLKTTVKHNRIRNLILGTAILFIQSPENTILTHAEGLLYLNQDFTSDETLLEIYVRLVLYYINGIF